MPLRKVAVVLAFVAAPLAANAAPPAKGGTSGGAATKACVAAHEEAQSLRTQKKLHAAREKFVACARSECPTVVRKECVEQLALVEKNAPTVALEARDDDGNDTTAVKVFVDGAVFAERLTGTAMNIEPGEHTFKFERADGKTIEQKVLVVEGEKNRKVIADYAALVPKPPPPPPVEGGGPAAKRSVPALAYVSGGLALAGFGVFTGFALAGKGAEKDLANSCSPRCTDDQLSPVKRDYLIADIGLVVGLVATAAAVILAWPALTGQPDVTTAQVSRTPAPWLPRVKVKTP